MTCFLCHFEQNGGNTSPIKIASRNRIFTPLGIEPKPIENWGAFSIYEQP